MTDHGFKAHLDKQDWALDEDDRAGHLNYIKTMLPIVKSMEQAARAQVFTNPRFTADEQEAIHSAIRILNSSLIPICLIKRKL